MKLNEECLIEGLKVGKLARVACAWRVGLNGVWIAPERVGINDQVVPVAKRKLDGFDQIRVAVYGCGAIVSAHRVFETPDGGIVEHVVFVDQVFHVRAPGFLQHARHRAFIKIEQERRTLTA